MKPKQRNRLFKYKDSFLTATEARKLLGHIHVGESILCVRGSTEENTTTTEETEELPQFPEETEQGEELW